MMKILARFWLRRFILIFVAVFVCLVAVELGQQGITVAGLVTVAGWSFAAALIAASVATYWGYRIQCKVVFGDSVSSGKQRQG